MVKNILKSTMMFLSSIATVFIGCVIASVSYDHGAGIFGALIGTGIAISGVYSAFDIHRTFYRQNSK